MLTSRQKLRFLTSLFDLISYLVPHLAGPDECLYFVNEDGSMIPPDIFVPYVNQNFMRQNDKVYVGIINTKDATIDIDLADNGNSKSVFFSKNTEDFSFIRRR